MAQYDFQAIRETQEEAFALIENPNDWRAPIDAVIEAKDFDRCVRACEFFTSTELEKVEELHYGKFYRVTAVGYRNGPAGP